MCILRPIRGCSVPGKHLALGSLVLLALGAGSAAADTVLVEALRRPTLEETLETVKPQVRAGMNGEVALRCVIAGDGTLKSCRVETETPEGWGFAEAALSLAPKYLFAPRLKQGQPVESPIGLTVSFEFTPKVQVALRCHGYALADANPGRQPSDKPYMAEIERRAAAIEAAHPYRAMTQEAARSLSDVGTLTMARIDDAVDAAMQKNGRRNNGSRARLLAEIQLADMQRTLGPEAYEQGVAYCRQVEAAAFHAAPVGSPL